MKRKNLIFLPKKEYVPEHLLKEVLKELELKNRSDSLKVNLLVFLQENVTFLLCQNHKRYLLKFQKKKY